MTDSTHEQAASLLAKVRDFAQTLDDSERELFAVLLGPGVEALAGGDEVEGFGQRTSWEPGSLRDRLSGAIENSEWQIVDRR